MPEAAKRTLTESIRLWRVLFIGACTLTGILAIGGFIADQRTARRVFHSSDVLREATDANHTAWNAESAVRKHLLRMEGGSAARYASARDSLLTHLEHLSALTRDNPEQQARVTTLREAIETWHGRFGVPAFDSSLTVRDVAVSGTLAFDAVTAAFDELIEAETQLRLERISAQRRVSRAGLAVLLLTILLSAFAFARTARQLSTTIEASFLQHRRAEEQAAELAHQATQLQEQAAMLEEQAAELEQRLEERDQTNALLERTATFLDSALESAPIGVAFYDRSLRFQRVNEAIARINGIPAERHIGHSIEEVIPKLAPTIRPIMERVLARNQAEPDVLIEGETPARPGAMRRWLVTYYPIAIGDQAPLGVGAMVLDVTERTLLEEQLRQAQKMEAVGRLAGGIAHDFNNILTIIQSYAELLIADLAPGAPWRMEVEAIRGAADRATALSRQLLSFSRREVIIPRDLDLNEVVRGMETIIRRLLRQGMELEIDYHASPLNVRVDAGQLEQVLMNLAINAVDAMPGGGTLRIRSSRSAEMPRAEGPCAEDCAVLSVSDTGSGMTKEVQERLFEPFFTTKPAGQGTGLGLATAYAIVRDAHGVIRVESTVGRGSEFDVFLPISATPEPKPEQRPSPARGATVSRAHERVLLAEDEPAIRQALARVLRTHGYEVIEAANGGEALRLAEAEPGKIDLLLTDVMMPGIGGKELAQRLRDLRPGLRVILMSGYTDDELLRAELGDARHEFLQKPFAARTVVEAVRTLLDAE
jgi:two-component system cell cycle sensor histidine kinase/response regulator CckA